MSQCICVAGLSNSGKSTSLKYLNPEETFIISCTNKQLQIPGFRKKYIKVSVKEGKLAGNWLVSNRYDSIEKMLKVVSEKRPDIKTIVIDDINYCLSNEIMETALIKGYEKFSTQAKNYYDLIMCANSLRDDLVVVLISHIVNEGTDVEPYWQLYTSGKMLNSKVNIDGLFSYIIYCERYQDDDDKEIKYRFRTRTNGNDTCRSVADCFKDKYIEPNMQMVIDRIKEFELGE